MKNAISLNKNKLFIKISKRGNSNLRDVYLRALKLGGLKENLIENDWDSIDLLVEFDKSNKIAVLSTKE